MQDKYFSKSFPQFYHWKSYLYRDSKSLIECLIKFLKSDSNELTFIRVLASRARYNETIVAKIGTTGCQIAVWYGPAAKLDESCKYIFIKT